MRPKTLALVAAATVASSTLGLGLVSTLTAAAANPCNAIPSLPVVPNPFKVACTVVTSAPTVVANPLHAIGSVLTAPIRAAGDAVMQGVTSWVADGAAWLVGEAATLIQQTTTPTLSAPWFTGQYKTMAGLAAIFALPLLFLSILDAVFRRDARIMIRAAFVQLPAAFLLTAGAVVVVGLLVAMTDQLCAQITGSVSGDAKSFFSDVAKALTNLGAQTGTGPVVPLFAVFLGGLIAAVGAFFVWIELLIRSAAIYVAVLFLPFTFVAMIWPQTARWCRRLVELLFAIVFAKFVIVSIIALAAAGLLSGGSGHGFDGVLAGTALLLLAAFSPLALLRLLPFVESAAHAATHRSGVGAQTVGPIAGPAAVMRRVMDGNSRSAGGGLRAAPAGAAAAAGPIAFGAAAGAAGVARAGRNASRGGGSGNAGERPAGAAASAGGTPSNGQATAGRQAASAPAGSAPARQAQQAGTGPPPTAGAATRSTTAAPAQPPPPGGERKPRSER